MGTVCVQIHRWRWWIFSKDLNGDEWNKHAKRGGNKNSQIQKNQHVQKQKQGASWRRPVWAASPARRLLRAANGVTQVWRIWDLLGKTGEKLKDLNI